MITLEQFAAQFGEDAMLERGIAVQLNKSSQLLPLLRIQKMKGLIHKFGREESGGGIARRVLNAAFGVTAPGVIVPAEEKAEIAGAHITTDYRMVQSNAGARGNEIARRTRTLGRYVDKQLISGAGTTDATQIVGLKNRLADETDAQVVVAGTNGAVLTLAMFESLIDAVEDQGNGRFVLAPKVICRKLKQLIVASAGGASVAEATGEIMNYEGVKVYQSGRDETGAELLPLTETQGSSNATASLYCIAPGDADDTGTGVLMASNSIEVIEEGIRDSFYHDQLEIGFGLSIFTKRSAARLKGAKAA